MEYYCLSHGETKEHLKYLIDFDVKKIKNGVKPGDIFKEIMTDYELNINPISVKNARMGQHCRALAYACIELGITDIDKISGWVLAEYNDILEKEKNIGSK